MKLKKLLILLLAIFPFKIFASGGYSVSPSSITMYVGETKTITITSDNSVGKLNIVSQNDQVVTSDTSSIFMETPGSSKTFNITAKSLGTNNISVIASSEYATMDEEKLEGQVKVITVNVIEKETKVQENKEPSQVITNVVENKKSNVSTIKAIEIATKEANYNETTKEYSIEVDSNNETVDIKIILTDSKATYEINGPEKLTIGNNKYTIIVTSEDKTSSTTYALNILRKAKSNNTIIKSLKINNYNLNFNSDIKNYNLNISNEDYLTFDIELEDEKSSYEIIGNKNLENNSIIDIKVTAEDDSVSVYSIKVNKANSSTYKYAILLSISIILNIISIGFISLSLIKKKRIKNDIS